MALTLRLKTINAELRDQNPGPVLQSAIHIDQVITDQASQLHANCLTRGEGLLQLFEESWTPALATPEQKESTPVKVQGLSTTPRHRTYLSRCQLTNDT